MDANAPDNPTKHRRRTLVRFVFWVTMPTLAAAAILAIVFLVVLHRVESAVASRIAALEAAGEPLTLAELAPPQIPADQNGAVDILEALSLLPGATEEDAAEPDDADELLDPVELEKALNEMVMAWDRRPPGDLEEGEYIIEDEDFGRRAVSEYMFYYHFTSGGTKLPSSDEDVRKLREIHRKYEPALEAARRGLAKPSIMLDTPYELTFDTNPYVSRLQRLSWSFVIEGKLAGRDGDGRKAFDVAASLLGIGLVYETDWTLISLNLIPRDVYRSWKRAQAALEEPPVPPERLRELAASYIALSDRLIDLGLSRLRANRAAFLEMSSQFREGDISEFMGALLAEGYGSDRPRKLSWTGKPMRRLTWRTNDLLMLETTDDWMRILQSAGDAPVPGFPLSVPSKRASLAAVWLDGFRRLPRTINRMNAHLRTGAIGLEVAARIAEGEPPPADLSGFDKALSTDPATGKPLLVKTTPSAWIVYSVGANRTDDNAVGLEDGQSAQGADDIYFRVPLEAPTVR